MKIDWVLLSGTSPHLMRYKLHVGTSSVVVIYRCRGLCSQLVSADEMNMEGEGEEEEEEAQRGYGINLHHGIERSR